MDVLVSVLLQLLITGVAVYFAVLLAIRHAVREFGLRPLIQSALERDRYEREMSEVDDEDEEEDEYEYEEDEAEDELADEEEAEESEEELEAAESREDSRSSPEPLAAPEPLPAPEPLADADEPRPAGPTPPNPRRRTRRR